MQLFEFQKSAAAITGASSGIGRALALELAARGCDLALADLNLAGLESLAKEIAASHARRVTIRQVDVGDPRQIQSFAETAIADFPNLGILINNAGVALLGQFEEYDQSQLEWLMAINFWGVVHGTRAFLPHLRGRPQAHIVNISSIFGIIAPAGQTAYCAASSPCAAFRSAAPRTGDEQQSGAFVGGASRRRENQHRAKARLGFICADSGRMRSGPL